MFITDWANTKKMNLLTCKQLAVTWQSLGMHYHLRRIERLDNQLYGEGGLEARFINSNFPAGEMKDGLIEGAQKYVNKCYEAYEQSVDMLQRFSTPRTLYNDLELLSSLDRLIKGAYKIERELKNFSK